ncbi:MAG: DUF4105 domain-containing protein [Victivallaceae bacterium]|nr:DUF4105 domain-containing protein [Victivallaceae bacterium]
MKKVLVVSLTAVWAALLFAVGMWSVGAVAFSFGFPVAAVVFYAVFLLTCWCIGFKRRLAWFLCAVPVVLAVAGFAAITPGLVFRDAVWQSSWGRLPHVRFEGENKVRIANIRNFNYRSETDFDVRYAEEVYPLDQVASIDVALSHWDGLDKVAHTMISFNFTDGRHLALSMETRLPEGESQDFLRGLYKRYEIIDVMAFETDLYKLRTDYRGEDLYLYRTNATPEQAAMLFAAVLHGARRLEKQPAFYNSITTNCTTSLAPALRLIDAAYKDDIRELLNGYSDELLFELGYLKHREGESFAELKQRRRVSQYLQDGDRSDKHYSETIRTNL